MTHSDRTDRMNWLFKRRTRVSDAGQLADFLSRHAAYIAQKGADDYCRNKVGLSHYALEEEKAYRDALARCRWEGYAAVLSGLAIIAQRFLLNAGGDAGRISAELERLCRHILDQQSLPEHRPEGWADVLAALRLRLLDARENPPPLPDIAAAAGRRLFEVLPIHQRYRELDEPVVVGAVHFNMVAFSDRFRREVDAAAIARNLATPAPATQR